jgi:mRNA interferase RelE/StbE
MNIRFADNAEKDYGRLEQTVRTKVDKQLNFLAANLRHPSLKAKKYHEANDVWQARVDQNYRFYFQIRGDTYIIPRIISDEE